MTKQIWQALNWDCHPNVKAGFSLKNEGYPQGFNLAKHAFTQDQLQKIAQVEENRSILQKQIQTNKPIIWLNQIHSDVCVEADLDNIATNADATYSNDSRSICAVLTADCLPIFLASKDGKEVAVVHGGWRGLLSGVIQNTLKHFKSDHIQAFLGPAIGIDAFEVGCEVRDLFIAQSESFQSAFAPEHTKGKTMANIYEIAKIILASQGVLDVQGGDFCTVSEERFFSYRKGDKTGRLAHLIWIAD